MPVLKKVCIIKGKINYVLRRKFFPFRVDPFAERAKTLLHRCLPLKCAHSALILFVFAISLISSETTVRGNIFVQLRSQNTANKRQENDGIPKKQAVLTHRLIVLKESDPILVTRSRPV